VASRYNRKTVSSSSLQALARQSGRPTWAEISLAALRANFRAVQNPVGQSVAVRRGEESEKAARRQSDKKVEKIATRYNEQMKPWLWAQQWEKLRALRKDQKSS
jgi:hypothetical protein